MLQVKYVSLWAHKLAMRSLLLAGATTLFAVLALAPKVSAEVVISINQPVCSYGYYDYSPYACAPSGFYGPGYFYNGIFLGMGPWANWGYGHGWGEHRFSHSGGGRYVAHGNAGARPSAVRNNHAGGPHGNAPVARSHAEAAHSGTSHGASHAEAAHGGTSHGASHTQAAHSSGGHESHGGGQSHGGAEHASR
jgi:hypothetical protein